MPKTDVDAHDASEQWVSVEQIAQHLNVKPFTIYKWLERKDMPAHKVGRLWRFKPSEIDAWVRSGEANSSSGRRGTKAKASKKN
jgi:excisionase family DNA binding protein